MMTREQRYRYEMFVRVRDYGVAHAGLFPESSTGGQMFGQVTAAVGAIDDHLANRVVAQAHARKVKGNAREAVFEYMKRIALTARRITRLESDANPFRLPTRRSVKADLAAATAFMREAEPRQEEFVRFGLPPTFISEFRALVDELQSAVDVRLSSNTGRRLAQAGIKSELAKGLEVIRDLDAVVANATRRDPVRSAAWQAARRIHGQGATPQAEVKEPVSAAETTPPDAGVKPAPQAVEPEVALGRAS